MRKVVNILLLVLIILFIFNVFKYYSSNKNIENTNFNRINVDKLLKSKINNLPVLENDTDNVIVFNDMFSEQIQNDTPRSFWDLLKSK
tara:strand:+ start:150 stop:413 length:264 start_codon:yes stop_codon:yes gene_type:complete